MSVDVAPAIQEEEHVHMLAESFLAPSNAPESLDVSEMKQFTQDSTHIDTTLDDASGGVGAAHDIVEEGANVADNATDIDATTNEVTPVDDAIEIASIVPQTPIINTPAAEDDTPVVESTAPEDVQNGRPQSPSVATEGSGTPTEVLHVEADTTEDAVHANEGALHDGAGSEDIASVPNSATEVLAEEGSAPELDAEVSLAEETPIQEDVVPDIKVDDISGVDDVVSSPQVHPTAESEPEVATSAPYSTTEDASAVTEESSPHDVVAEVPLAEEIPTALQDTTTVDIVPTVPIEGSTSEDIVPIQADTIPAVVESEPEAASVPIIAEDVSVAVEESIPVVDAQVPPADALPDTTTVDAVPTVPIEGSTSEGIVPVTGDAQADAIPAIVESEPEAASVPIIAEVVEESIPVVDDEVPPADALPDTTTVDTVPTVPIEGSTSEGIVPVTEDAQADAIPAIVESEPEAASVPIIAEVVEESIPVVDAEVPPAEEAPAQSQEDAEDLADAAEVESVPQASDGVADSSREETQVADPEAYLNNTVVVEEFTKGHIEPATEGSSAHEEPGERLGVDAQLSTAVEGPGEVQRPKSPWTPSYSVTTQGPSAELEAADLAELPPPVEVVASLPGDGTTQDGAVLTVVEPEPEVAGESDPSSTEETVAGQNELTSAVNADVETALLDEEQTELEPRPNITVNIPAATEDTGPLQAISEDQLQPDKLSAAHDDEEVVERPKSPWTPSYSVTTQGPGIPTLDELEVADLPVLPPPAEISSDATEDVTHDVAGSGEPEIVVEEPDTASVLVSVAPDELSSEEAEMNVTAEALESDAKTLVVEATSIETNADLDTNVDTVAEVNAGEGVAAEAGTEDPPQLAILRDQQEIDRPTSPWTPSYSVTTQGPAIPTPDELEAADLAVLPPPGPAEVISEDADALSTTDTEAAATQDQAIDAVLEQDTSSLAQETTIGRLEESQLVPAAEDPEILLYVSTAQDVVPDITVDAHDDAIAGDDAVQASEDPTAAESATIQASSPLGEPVEEIDGVAEVAQLDDVDNQVPEGSFETTEQPISAASASLVAEAEVHEAELVTEAKGDVIEEADAKGTTEGLSSADASLSTNEREIERPKSPWTPSYSVTTQGPGIPTSEELEVADLPVLPPPVQISEPGTIEPQPDPASAQSAEPAVTVTSVTDAEAEVPSSSGPTRPWTPSYSVVVQGSPLSAPVGLDSQESAMEAPLETVDVDAPASEDEPNSNVATESSVAMTSLIESGVIVDPATLQDPDVEDDDAPDPSSDAVVAALIESGVLADSITDPVDAPAGALLSLPVAQEGPESALEAETAAEDLESEIMTTSQVPEIETHLSTAQPEPERPKSPWTPSYTVTQQGPVSDGNPEETTAPVSETIADTEQEGLIEPVMNVSTPTPEAPLEAPRATSPWTPSYSVSVQGSPLPVATELTESRVQDDAVVDSIDPIHESTATEEVSVDASTGDVLQEPPVDSVVITEPSAQAESVTEPISEVVVDAAVPVPSEEAFDPARTEIGNVIDNAAVEESVASVVVTAEESSEEAVDPTVIEDAEVAAGEDTVAEGITEDQTQLLIPQEQEPERPKSPWTPSYSVTTQGLGIPTTDELEAADLPALPPPAAEAALSATEDVTQVAAIAESEPEAVHDQDDSVPISAAPEEALTAEEVSVTGAEDKTLLAEDTAVIPEEHPGINASLAPEEQELERPKSPWTPSYSVVTQGPGIPTTDELEAADLPALPPPAEAALSATEDVPQVAAVAESELEAVHDQDASVPISAAPEEALTAEEVSATGVEDKTLLAEDTAVIPEEHPGVNALLAPEEQEPERPRSPWTPSYSVTTQGPGIPTTDELEAADLPALAPSVEVIDEVIELKADEDDAPATDAVAEDASTLAAVPANVPEVASVAEEHAATSTEGLKSDELETVEIEPAGGVAEVPVSVQVLDGPGDSPAPENADSTTVTDAESSVIIEEVAPLESTEEPPVPVTDDVPGGDDTMSTSTSPVVAAPVNVTESEVTREQADDDSISVSVETPADTPVNDSTPLASAVSLPEEQQLHPFPVSLEIPFSADDVDEVPPISPRSRLESTASSLFFPGGWFSKVPVERASLDVAQGEFTPSKPSSPSVPSAPPPTATEETTEEKKGRWCVVM